MFKNFTPLVIAAGAFASPDAPFVPCERSQAQSLGFSSPTTITIERKAVPAEVLKRRVDELAEAYFQQHGRKPGKKARAELKEQVTHELLAVAFPKRKTVELMVIPEVGLLLIGSTSGADVDAITPLLVRTIDGLDLGMVTTTKAPLVALADWLVNDDAPVNFSLGRECLLSGEDGKVRFTDHSLTSDAVTQHVRGSKWVDELQLTFGEHLTFTVTPDLAFKGCDLAGLVNEVEDHADAHAADRALWSGTLTPMLVALIDELGGLTGATQ